MSKITPSVNKATLIFLAGLLWLVVGIVLMSLAYSWLHLLPLHRSLLCFGIGISAALVVHHFGFLKIVDRNLERILPMEGKKCLFSFMPWRSYLMVAFMAALGGMLRHSSLPKPYLAIIYIVIGLALALSSLRYFRFFIGEFNRNRPA
jgi:hypothetical protein